MVVGMGEGGGGSFWVGPENLLKKTPKNDPLKPTKEDITSYPARVEDVLEP